MKVCLACGARYEGAAWRCRQCGAEPVLANGFPAFAPQLAVGDSGYKADYYAEIAQLEAGNFWFRARNRLILWALQKHFPQVRSLLEIGCGTGYVLAGIANALPQLQLAGSEIYSAGLPFAARRVPQARLMQMDARAVPYADEFDVVCAFDVIEHIEQDEQVLAQMYQATKPGGGLLLTVPQHPFLWSQVDEAACHVRRYSARELRTKVQGAGFRVTMTASFVALLLPLMLASRLKRRRATQDFDVLAELRIGKLANAVLEKFMALEGALIRIGLKFPCGGSLLLVATKPK
ncbi:MAG: class I SAM-dependent methyltransferase [Pseudomonadota bacterium]